MAHYSFVVVASLCFASSVCVGQVVRAPASDAEVREVMRLSGYDRVNEDRVVGFEVWRVFNEAGSYFIAAQFQLTPAFAQSAVCIAPHYYVEYENQEEGLSQNDPLESFEYWLAESDSDCQRIDETANGSVVVQDAIATDAVISISRGASELLSIVLNHPSGEQFRARQTNWRIRDISISWFRDSGLGFAYVANFEGSDVVPNGPFAVFTMRGTNFNVHEVGEWAY